jgi:hypothetical protein
VCMDFKMLKVKVPIIFSGTQGFPARRDGRYSLEEVGTPVFIDVRCIAATRADGTAYELINQSINQYIQT